MTQAPARLEGVTRRKRPQTLPGRPEALRIEAPLGGGT